MPIIFKCPLCRHKVKVSRKEASTSRPCPGCGEAIKVPSLPSAGAPDDDVEIDENSDKPPASPVIDMPVVAKTFDDETFVVLAKKLGFPDDAMLERFRALRAEKGGEGVAWRLHALIRTSGGISDHQQQLLEAAAEQGLGAAPAKESPFSKPIPSARKAAAAKAPPPRLVSDGKVRVVPTPPRDRQSAAILVVAGLSVMFIAGAVLLLLQPPKIVVPQPPSPDVAIVATSAPPPIVPAGKKTDAALEAAFSVIHGARGLEKDGKEIESETTLERALETTRSPDARRALVAARRALLDRSREKMLEACDEGKKLALAGKLDEANKLILDYVEHMPVALRPDFEKEIRKLNDELYARAPKQPRNVKVRYGATPGGDQPARSDEPARFAKLELALDDVLRRLDADGYPKALAAAGTFADAERAAQVAYWKELVESVLALASAALPAFEKQVGTEVDVALWKGAPASGTLLKVEARVLTLRLRGGGERDLDLGELSARAFVNVLRSTAAEERFQFALGVLCLVHEDLPVALDFFQHAPSIGYAQNLVRYLDEKGVKPAPATAKPEPAKPVVADAGDKASSGDITEQWPNGQPKRRYSQDEKGRIVGLCTEFDEDGRPRVRAHYRAGVLHGEWLELHANGKTKKKGTYNKGRLEGELWVYDESGKVTFHGTYADARLLYTRTKEEIQRELAAIEVAPVRTPDKPGRTSEFAPLAWDSQAKALRRLRAYRYLCGVPHDVELGWEYGETTSAAVRLLELVGHLEHTPARPAGCSEVLYKAGYEGTSKSNLHWNSGGASALESVDNYMDDSDPKNVDRVGHRRWCLSPTMGLTAFGVHKDFSAMYAFDHSRKIPTPDRVAYPAAGWFPSSFLARNTAWSISLDPNRYRQTGDFSVTVSPADEHFLKLAAVPLEDVRVSTFGSGTPLCVIFRPKCSLERGTRYFVEIKGFSDGSGPIAIEYYVELF